MSIERRTGDVLNIQLPESTRVPKLFQQAYRQEFRIKPFVVVDSRTLTYGELCDVMAQVGGFFQDLGIVLGDRVVICTKDDLYGIELYISALRSAVTPVLIDPNSSPDEMRTLIAAAKAKCLFIDASLLKSIRHSELPSDSTVIPIRDHDGHAPSEPEPTAQTDPTSGFPSMLRDVSQATLPSSIPDETSAFILFTSGTTSKPKGVEVTYFAVLSHVATMHRQYGYDSSSRVLNGLPLHHSDGINHGAVNVMACGGTLFRAPAFTVQRLPEMLRMIHAHSITHLITVPTVLGLISRLGNDYNDCFRSPTFRFISSTAGPLDETLWRSFEQRFGTMIVNSYGLTETVCEGFYCGPSEETRRIGTIGKPIDIDARIVDELNRDVTQGNMGELVLRGSCLMKGYFEAPEETAAVLRDGWLHTGDLAIKDDDGFYSIVGRKKNVIICGGINIYPEDVSRTIARLDGVMEAVTIGVPDDTWGEKVVSCVTLKPLSDVSSEAIISFCRAHLAREKVPSNVLIIGEFPRGPAGKVALPQLKSIAKALLQGAPKELKNSSESSTDIDGRVLAVAARAFSIPIDELSPDSESETTEGWHSLAHVSFLVALEAEFAVTISPEEMLSIVTLRDAMDVIRRLLRQ